MGSLVLTVGTGSTWAMRASLVLAMSGLEWQEQVFDLEDAKALQRLKRTAPAGLVPWLDDGELRIHDSLAIAEYLHELCPARHLYPTDRAERALARSLCAELHAGFGQIRSRLPFFLGAPTQSEPPVETIGELRHFAARSGGRLSASLAGLAPVAGDPGQGTAAVAGHRPAVGMKCACAMREGSHWLPSSFVRFVPGYGCRPANTTTTLSSPFSRTKA